MAKMKYTTATICQMLISSILTIQQPQNSHLLQQLMILHQEYQNRSTQTKKDVRIKLRKLRQTAWTIKEQTVYIQFLKKEAHSMRTTKARKANKVFKRISELVGTRTAVQVKSHHQKLEKKYETINNIIYHVNLYIKKALKKSEEDGYVCQKDNPRVTANEEGFLQELPSQRAPFLLGIHQDPQELFQAYLFEESEDYGSIEGTIRFDNHDLFFCL